MSHPRETVMVRRPVHAQLIPHGDVYELPEGTLGVITRAVLRLVPAQQAPSTLVATFPTLDSIACTINASRLIDTYGEQAAYQQRTINKVAGQGTMIKITIPIYEVTA